MSEVDPTHGVILGGKALPDAMKASAKRAGVLCAACEKVLEGGGYTLLENAGDHPYELPGPQLAGFEYIALSPGVHEGRQSVAVQRTFICSRAECREAREVADSSADFRRPMIGWQMLERGIEVFGDPDVDVPPPRDYEAYMHLVEAVRAGQS